MEPIENQVNYVEPSSQPTLSIVNNEEISSSAVTENIKYAGFWIRWASIMIDSLILLIPVGLTTRLADFLMGALGMNIEKSSLPTILLFESLGLLVVWLYFVLMTYKYQATLGKMAFGLVVTSSNFGELGIGRIILRETIGKLISGLILYIGFILAGFTEKKQAIHDKIANTLVVYKDPNIKFSSGKKFLIIIASILPFMLFAGLLISVILTSLAGAKDRAKKAQELMIKDTVKNILSNAVAYDNSNGTYHGFRYAVPVSQSILLCSGNPLIHISSDGNQLAIFMKSCQDTTRYYCIDLTSVNEEPVLVADNLAQSSASACASTDVISAPSSDSQKSYKANPSPVDQTTFNNVFNDSAMGFEILYPTDWLYKKGQDQSLSAPDVIFAPNQEEISGTVSVEKMAVEQATNTDNLTSTIDTLKRGITNNKGKYYDEKDFIYKFDDGTAVTGKHLKAEYNYNGYDWKQWLVIIPYKNNFYVFTYTSILDKYDSNYNIALAMLNSLKIAK